MKRFGSVPYVVMGLVVLLVAYLFRTHCRNVETKNSRHRDSILKENLMFGVLAQLRRSTGLYQQLFHPVC
jgi:hypothetical protein